MRDGGAPVQAVGQSAKRVLVIGYYGAGNTGDEAVLRSIVRGFAGCRKGVEFVVPVEDAARLGVPGVRAVSLRDMEALLDEVEACDLVIVGGGGLLHDYWDPRPETALTSEHFGLSYYCGIPWLAGQLGKPVMLYGIGAGPLVHPSGRDLVGALLSVARTVTTRDRESAELLLRLGADHRRVEVAADPAWLSRPFLPEKVRASLSGAGWEARRWVGVALRNWNLGVDQARWEAELAAGLREVAVRHGLGIALVPFQRRPTELQDDLGLARRIAARLDGSPAIVVEDELQPEEVAGVLGACELVVAMRYHALLFSCLAGVPSVAVAYDRKVDHLAAEAGSAMSLLQLAEVTGDDLALACSDALSSRAERVAAARSFAARAAVRAGITVEKATELLDAPPALLGDPAAELIVDRIRRAERNAHEAGVSPLFLVRSFGEARTAHDGRPGTPETAPAVRIVAPSFFDAAGEKALCGGAERYLVELAALVRSLGYPVDVYQPGAGAGWVRRWDGVRIVGLPSGGDPPGIGGAAARHGGPAALTIYLAFYLAGEECPPGSIGISHGVYWDETYYQHDGSEVAAHEARLLGAVRRLETVVSVDSNTINWFRARDARLADKFVLVPNFVDLEEFRPRPAARQERFVVLYPRRLRAARGFWSLAAIVPDLVEHHAQVDVRFVGQADAAEEEAMRRLLARYPDRVRWDVVDPDRMADVYAEAAVTVIPTIASEGTSLACLEAQACGCPVVVTHVGGLTDIVLSGYNGLVVEPGPAPLLAALERLIRDPALAEELARHGLLAVREFGKERWAERWLRVLRSHLAEPPRAGLVGPQPHPRVATVLAPSWLSPAVRNALWSLSRELAGAGLDVFWEGDPVEDVEPLGRLQAVARLETLHVRHPLSLVGHPRLLTCDSPPDDRLNVAVVTAETADDWQEARQALRGGNWGWLVVDLSEAGALASRHPGAAVVSGEDAISRAVRELLLRADDGVERRGGYGVVTEPVTANSPEDPERATPEAPRLEALLAARTELEGSLARLRARAAADQAEARASLAEAHTRLARLEGALAEAQEYVRALEGQVAAAQEHARRLEGQLAEVRSVARATEERLLVVQEERRREVEDWKRAHDAAQEGVKFLRSELSRWRASKWWAVASWYWRMSERFAGVRRRFRRWSRIGTRDRSPRAVASLSLPPTSVDVPVEPTHVRPAPVDTPEGFPRQPAGRYDVVVFSIIDWDFRFQRPQQLATQFGRHGHRVLYLSTSAFLPADGAPATLRMKAENVVEVRLRSKRPLDVYAGCLSDDEVETLAGAFQELIGALALGDVLALVQIPFWAPIARRMHELLGWKVVYDCMDEWGNFPGFGPSVLALEETLVREADLTVVSGDCLEEKFRPKARALVLAKNAVDLTHYRDRYGENRLLNGVRRPVIGYFGALASWVDGPLIEMLADTFSDASIVLAGGVFDIDLGAVEAKPNARLLGQRPYAEMPELLWNFDVCMIPFQINDITHATNPVKFYEYCYSGKPIVAPDLKELRPFADVCYLARDREEFVAHMRAALAERADDPRREQRKRIAEANDWSARYLAIHDGVMATFPRVSVVVVTFGGVELTRACLGSLLDGETWPNLEIIVVDNGSEDATPQALEEISRADGRVRVVLNGENRGFAAANNQGLGAASGEFLVLLNNDTVVPPGLIGALVHHLRRDRTIGLLCPTTNFCGNEARIEPEYADVDRMPAFAARRRIERLGKTFDIGVAAMYCVAMRRDAWETVGPLDEAYGIGMFEDDDYAMRMRAAGLRVACAEDAYVHHFGQGAFGLLAPGEYQALWDSNRAYFEKKWGIEWKNHSTRPGVSAVRSRVTDPERC
jgi:polysaccharide pyruvyl transferase CsaB